MKKKEEKIPAPAGDNPQPTKGAGQAPPAEKTIQINKIYFNENAAPQSVDDTGDPTARKQKRGGQSDSPLCFP
jgi:hypothetical protein